MKRKRSQSFILALVLGLTILISMTACSGGNSGGGTDNTAQPAPSDTSSSGDTGTPANNAADISGTITMSMISSNQPGMELVIADFENEYTNCKVNADFVADLDGYATQVTSRLAAGNAPDIIFMIPGFADQLAVYRFADAGYLMDLTNEDWVSDMYAPTKPLFMYNDQVVAKDYGFAPYANIIYDKNYFAANNLSIPTTYSELIDLCKKIQSFNDGITPICWGAGEWSVCHNNTLSMAADNVWAKDPDWLNKRLNDEITFTGDAGWRSTLEQLKEMIDLKVFGSYPESISFPQMAQELGDGKCAMAFTYGGLAGMAAAENPDVNLGQLAFPGVTADDTRIFLVCSGGLGINKDTKNADAAKAFLNFMNRPEESSKFAAASTIISPQQAKSGQLEGTYTDLNPIFTADNKVLPVPADYYPNSSFATKTGESIQGLFTGQKTVDQILADMDTYFAE